MIVGGPQRRVEQFHRISSGARQRVVKPVGAAGRRLEIWWFLAKLPNVGSEDLFGG
jgi:hypothetical protein